jgi:integrase
MASKMVKRVGTSGKTVWTCLVDVPADPVTGKRRQKRLSAPTKKALEEAMTRMLHEVHTGSYIEPSTTTTGAYLWQWLEGIAPNVRESSHIRYERTIKRDIIPALGSIPLRKLTPAPIQTLYATQIAAGRAASSVHVMHAVLHRALDQAVKWRLLPHNPADAVDLPRLTPPELQTWTAGQACTFLDGTAGDALAALWRLALLTGMRRGELLAVRWQDVDLERGALAVPRTLTRGRQSLIFTEPKSAAGRRSLALPASCVAALRRYKAQQNERRLQWGDSWQDTDLLFDRGDGSPMQPAYLNKRFLLLAARLGLPRIRLHDLRHTSATLALADGVHPKILQERLGHSNVSMTLNRYSHVSMSMQRDAADRLDRALGG